MPRGLHSKRAGRTGRPDNDGGRLLVAALCRAQF